MEINRAIDNISEIHRHLERSEVYRGFRSIPVALSGVAGFIAALFQPLIITNSPVPRYFIYYWVSVAAIIVLVLGVGLLWRIFYHEKERERGKTIRVLNQFLPCILAGFVVSFGAFYSGEKSIMLLPGLWAVIFGLGIFSIRPFQPRMSGWIALYYIISGTVLLALAPSGLSLSPWGIGLTFGIGQIMSGGVLYWNLERKKNA
jgi:hypothetical protein